MDTIRPNKKMVLSILGVLIVLVIAAGAGIGLRLLQNNKAAEKGDNVSFRGEPLPENVEDAQNLRVSGDVDGSIKKIDEAIADKNTSNDEKYQLYIQQGSAYYDKKDTDAAIASYRKAESIKVTYEITSLLATMYQEKGDNANAIAYYKKSIPLIPDTPMKAQYKATAEQRIQELGGQN